MRRIGCFVLAVAAAWPLAAQQVPLQRVAPLRDSLRLELEQARWRLGPVRLLPTLRLESVGYTNNATGVEGGPSDYLGTARGGARFVLPLGPEIFFHGSALPSYTWYAHLKERRIFGGLYDGGLAAFVGRLTLVAGGQYVRASTFASSELQTPVLQTTGTGHIATEVELFSRLSLVGSADASQLRYHTNALDIAAFTLLNSDSAAVRGGLKYRFRDRVDVSAQAEGTRTTFPNEEGLRDNQTTAYLLGIGYDRPRFYINLSGGYRKGRAYNGSAFPDFGGATGSYFISYFLTHRIEVKLYGHRDLISSLYAVNPYYVETSGGAALDIHIGHRITLTGFGELSTNRYPTEQPIGPDRVARRDQGRSYGGGFELRLFRRTILSAQASDVRFTSNIPGFDRSILTITSNLVFDAFQWGQQ